MTIPKKLQRGPDPKQWHFNQGDRDKFKGIYWRCPVRLVHSGLWAKLWRQEGTVRGGGAATSILPILALHTWPAKHGAEVGWTGWSYLSRRRMARLAGINKDTTTSALRLLEHAGLLQLKREPRGRYEGGYKTLYRLSAELYPKEDELYAEIAANLFYGGAWFMLPSAAPRHLYVAIACLDPIGDEASYLNKIAEDHNGGGPWWDDLDAFDEIPNFDAYDGHDQDGLLRIQYLGKLRQRHPASLTDLERATGLNRSTVISAVRMLLAPQFGDQQKSDGHRYPPIGLILKGAGRPGWYAPDRRASTWSWNLDFLSDPDRVARARSQIWGAAPAQRAAPKRTRTKARR